MASNKSVSVVGVNPPSDIAPAGLQRCLGILELHMNYRNLVTIQNPLFCEVFWHENAKIPRHASQNSIAEGDFRWILTRNCEGTEQLRNLMY